MSVLSIAIGTFLLLEILNVRLFPTIRSLDRAGHITPPGYSKALAWMIAGFMGLFAVALAWSFIKR